MSLIPDDPNGTRDAGINAIQSAIQIKEALTRLIALCDTGTLDLHAVAAVMAGVLKPNKVRLARSLSAGGVYDFLASHRPGVFTDATDAQTSFTGFQTAINSLITFLEANLPTSGGFLATQILAADGTGGVNNRTTNNAPQIAGFRAQLQTIRALIS